MRVAARPDPRRRDAAAGAMLGTFVGDALGMPFETWAPEDVPARVEMVEARLGRGTYTDDTEMAIALAESLVERGTVDPEHLARAFLAGFDGRRGYGGGTLEVLDMWRAGVPVEEAAARVFGGRGSLGNGAAMRVAPVGVLFASDPAQVERQAAASARLTHSHETGIDAAVVQAAAVAAAVRGDDPLGAAERAARTEPVRRRLAVARELVGPGPAPAGEPLHPAAAAATFGNGALGHESVPLAIYAAAAHLDFEAAVAYAIRCGGDTDTHAAMAGAIAGARDGASAIPARWLEALEDGPRGRSYVEALALRLASG